MTFHIYFDSYFIYIFRTLLCCMLIHEKQQMHLCFKFFMNLSLFHDITVLWLSNIWLFVWHVTFKSTISKFYSTLMFHISFFLSHRDPYTQSQTFFLFTLLFEKNFCDWISKEHSFICQNYVCFRCNSHKIQIKMGFFTFQNLFLCIYIKQFHNQ